MVVNVNITQPKSISNAIKQLEKYKADLIPKMDRFVSLLAEVGIDVVKDNTFVEYDGERRNFGDSVTFYKEILFDTEQVTCILTAEGIPYLKQWIGGEARVNPLLMAEFGSGDFALGDWKGKFPSSSAKRHTDNPPWYWRDSGGRLHKSTGSTPSRPLYKAKQEMEKQILDIARMVFKG